MVKCIGQERGHKRIVRYVGDVKRPSDRGTQDFCVVSKGRVHGAVCYKANAWEPSSRSAYKVKINLGYFSVRTQASLTERAASYTSEQGSEWGT